MTPMTPRERRTFDFSNLMEMEPQIIEDEQEIYGSYACINIGDMGLKRNSKDKNKSAKNSGNNSPVIF
jgi:hypothetical protein